MASLRVGGAGARRGAERRKIDRELGAEHRRQPHGTCRLGEAHHPVEAVVIA